MGGFAKTMGNLFFGSNSNKNIPQAAPPPPPPQKSEIDDVFDYIAGVQSITVTDEKGKKRQEIRKLPRTQDEEYFFQMGGGLMKETMRNMARLYSESPSEVVNFAPLVQAFSNVNQDRWADLAKVANLGNIQEFTDSVRAMQNSLIDEEFKTVRRNFQEDLAHRGLEHSTFAAESNAALAKEQALARQQGDIVARTFGEDLMDQRLARNITGYDLREQGRQGILGAAQLNYDLQQQERQDRETMRQTALQENANLFGLGAGLRNDDIALAVGSQAPVISQQNYANRLSAYGAQQQANNDYYNQRMAAFKARGPSNQEKYMSMLAAVAGRAAGGGFGGGGGRAGGGFGGRI